jgi:hydrogenase expression/formation protein HypC
MCLAIPARILSIEEDKATVDFGGVTRVISLALLPDTIVGDYVLVHTGYAIQKVDRDEAEKTLDLWREILSTEDSTNP